MASYRHRKIGVIAVVLFAVACKRDDTNAHIAKANAYFEQGHYPDAIIEYRRALQTNARLPEVRSRLAEAYSHTNDVPNAIREYVRVADLLPNDTAAQLKAGDALLIARRFEEAKARADKVLQADGQNVSAQILRGNALAGLKDFDGAIADYENAVAADPSRRQVFENLGTIQFLKGAPAEAESSFRKAVAAAPKAAEPRLALANFYWASNRQADAEAALKDAVATEPNSVEANRALGAFYVATGRVPQAEPFFETLAKVANTPASQASLAEYYMIANKPDTARGVLNDLLQRKDGAAIATVRLAALDAAEGQRSRAADRLRELLQKDPRNVPAEVLYGTILLGDLKRADAEAAAKAALGVDANSAPAHELAAQVAAQGDRLEAAIGEYEKALSLNPRSLRAAIELSRLHLALGHQDPSTAYAEQALAMAPRSPEAQDLLVRNYVSRGNVSKADELVAKLRKDYPNSPGPLNLTALIQLSRHDAAGARASYARALAMAPTNIEALTGVVRLDVLAHNPQLAIAQLDAVATTAKPSVDLLLAMARGYATVGQYAKSEAVLKRAIELDPARLQGYSFLGQIYAGQNRLDEAHQQFDQLLKQDPSSVSAQTMVGMIEEAQGHGADAEKSYQRALTTNARAAVAANNLAWIYVENNRNLDEALRLAEVAFEQLNEDPHVMDTLGWVLVKKDMQARAVPLLETAAKKTPEEAGVRYHLGLAYYKAGDWNKSRSELQKALSLKPDPSVANDARKTLTIIGG